MPHIERFWQSVNPVSIALLPLAGVFALVAATRRLAYRIGLLRTRRFRVPVIIVGNITVGGTGKTPLVVWLAGYLRDQGWRPGIVARGYGGRAQHWPQQVRGDSDPETVGDEAVLLASRTGCPACVAPDRPAAVAALLAHTGVDIVIADDGLQHYALGRDLEIAVIDGQRRLGNGWLLPAGPLRESRARLRRVDLVVVNGAAGPGEFAMKLFQPTLATLHGGARQDLAGWRGRRVHAVAGIGHPERFFAMLERHGLELVRHPLPDHHPFRQADLQFGESLPVLMTEKDAVKCRRLECRDCWVVTVDAQPDAAFVHRLNAALKDIIDGQETARHPGLPDL